jgi:hypothetical protein
MPSASVQSGSAGDRGAWLKVWERMSDIQPVMLPNPPQVFHTKCSAVAHDFASIPSHLCDIYM